MIRLVCFSCYFDLMFYMKNNSPQVFYNGPSGYLQSIDKITNMRTKIERTCADLIGIRKDSVVFVCFDCVEYQIRLIDRKRLINSLLELQCFNFKKNHMCFVLISANEMRLGCKSLCCKVFLFNDFHTLYLE